MDFLGSSWGREFAAGGVGGVAGVISGYPLDTLRILQQNSKSPGSAFSLIRKVVAKEGLISLYRGMAAPLASVSLQVILLLSRLSFSANFRYRKSSVRLTKHSILLLNMAGYFKLSLNTK